MKIIKLKQTLCMTLVMLLLLTQFSFAQGKHALDLQPTEQYHVKLIKDVNFSQSGEGNQPNLSMDILRPTSNEPLPAIVYITGNAWRYADRSVNLPMFSEIARSGYVIVFIDWRASTNHLFPAQLEDAKTAVRFLRANAAKYNIDPDQIGTWGHSSGAHLAAMLGTTGGIADFDKGDWPGYSSKVQAVAAWSAPIDLLTINPPSKADELHLIYESILTGLNVYDPANAAKVAAAGPTQYITPDDPAFLLMYGDSDPVIPIKQGEDFHEALIAGGVDSTFYTVIGGVHSSIQFTNQERLMTLTKEFFDRELKGK
ncbi:alpha/beta hydrolase [Anoxynatronum buryatiense]|uniref:Acetyl esterase/lipase n=1 Tax=Anoxynatronum buryatiense TaxID=489973 RepID=A0AA45WXN4_9CLOT|nr:alpha/beta hydrolase [Anoxynatronum buryatiense]SMP65278.1 Acetyl esterase/lipase [Anoxynatronum buryatiense]